MKIVHLTTESLYHTCFSWAHDYEQAIKVLKNKGIICCPTAIDETNDKNIDLFHLKRVLVV